MHDSPVAVSTPPPETEAERTARLRLPDTWQWPDRDPDPPPENVIAEAHTALHRCEEPTLPILHAVLDGLRRQLPHTAPETPGSGRDSLLRWQTE